MTTQFSPARALNYDAKVKLKGNTTECFSPKYLKNTYPQGGCKVLGEITGRSEKKAIGEIRLEKDRLFDVTAPGKHSGLLWRKAGYVQVGTDEYVTLLKSRIPFLLLLALLLAIILFLLSLLMGGDKGPTYIDPDHPLPPVDTNAKPIEGDDTEKTDVAEGGGSVSMIYTLEARNHVDAETVAIYFKNPNASSHNVIVELIVVSDGEEYPIACSGLLEPGYELREIAKLEDAPLLKEGVYTGLYRLQCFDPVTGERALVSPEITGVSITVNE